jgi:hypothetical protein
VNEQMFNATKAFSSFSVDDVQKAKEFYAKHSDWKFPKLPVGSS